MSTFVSTAVSPPELADLLRGRRTIHLFEKTPVSRSLILEAIDVARWAPNHKLTEPWRFYLVGPDTATKIAHLNSEIATKKRGEKIGQAKLKRWLSMPNWLVVTCSKSDDNIREREDFAACCCAVQNMSIFLWNQGVGMKWASGSVTRDPRIFELLDIDPAREFIVGLFWYGYPAEIPTTDRNPVESVTREIL